MGYIFLVVTITLVFFIMAMFLSYIDHKTPLGIDILKWFSVFFLIISLLTLFISVIVLVCCNANVNAVNERHREVYNSLIYQLENHIYDDDLVGKKELYNQIEKYNTNYAYTKQSNKNPWVGAFFPDTYEGLEKIELGDLKGGK